MANSSRYRTLKSRLVALRQHLLPAKYSPTGSYTKRQLDRVLSYRILVHAEFEAFVEDIAWAALMKRVGDWKNRGILSDVLFALIVCYHLGVDVSDDADMVAARAARKKVKDGVEKIVDAAVAQYTKSRNENHGIRIDNLKKLLQPVGIEFDQLDPTWLTSMDDFGKKRGEAAHNSIQTQQPIDPLTEYNYIQSLMVGIKDLDERVLTLAG